MRILDDKKRGLVWCKLGKFEDFKAEDYEAHNDFRKELNSWSTHPNFAKIQEYILGSSPNGGYSDFGSFMQSYNHDNRSVFYAFDHGEMVGVCVTTSNAYLHDYVKLKMYLQFCKEHGIDGVNGCLSVSDINYAFNNDNGKNNSYIDYIATNPKLFGRGYGTRMVSSIKNIPTFFLGVNDKSEVNLTRTCIHNTNDASKEIFKRNGFLPIYEDYISLQGFHEYFNIPNAPDSNSLIIPDNNLLLP